MANYSFIVWIVVFLFAFWGGPAIAQEKSLQSFYFEMHAAAKGSFGPDKYQAELVGDVNENSSDKKKHFVPEFKEAFAIELIAGYQEKEYQLQSSVSYFKQDIRLVQSGASSNQYQFVHAEMLSIKLSSMVLVSNYDKRGPYGWYIGVSAGTILPISIDINDDTKTYFAIDDFRPSAQYYWCLDGSYNIRLGQKGFYMLAGFSIPIPGLLGSIGKITMEPNSTYTSDRNEVKMHSFTGFLGIGFRLHK